MAAVGLVIFLIVVVGFVAIMISSSEAAEDEVTLADGTRARIARRRREGVSGVGIGGIGGIGGSGGGCGHGGHGGGGGGGGSCG